MEQGRLDLWMPVQETLRHVAFSDQFRFISMKSYIVVLFAAGLVVAGCSKKDEPAAVPAPEASNSTSAVASASGSTNSDLVTTASGLKYQVLKHGAGTASPKATDTVKVHYHGTLLDGTVFDSSVERGKPISFPLDQVIRGWTEGVQLMKVGDKFKFVIPPELAYGANSPSSKIPPNSTLVFEVELLAIE
jgi:FKBP-type peptidyl-prolyl cis-trans isomerase